ncbi:phospholipid carrier-dependent glycosyltransferase [Brachybacterium huguangmaarense]|uniref:Polyprenol-phosphate-mannose--protein mannosyltransferase n=1 Tax=Brachybacterium huguangmaarense TaxID=1652028 RepID=A0ABY6G195_9MICO|nr:phospholipid carrier-dependent glycosyltransferase [Brachybacterium huguangmaarense]UYG16601.1 phospholipid carrier-dependent glycosyltransferase [Brachybacterium huguangmaarense]
MSTRSDLVEGADERPAPPAPEVEDADEATLLATARRRLRIVPLTDRVSSWWWALAVFAIALVLRLWGLGSIRTLIFDETYYVKDGYTLWKNGTEMAWPDDPNPAWEAGRVDTYLPQGEYVVHPPVGKWVIGAGEALLGADNPWGWRISVALLGALSVLLLARIGRRLFRSTTVGTIAALLLAVDGLHLVMSRTGLLDMVLSFFVLAAFGCLLLDRDRFRERLAAVSARAAATGEAVSVLGIRSGLRPWRIGAGVLLGLACGVKWSGIYVLAVFGVMTVLWDWWARRRVRERRWFENGLFRDAIPAFFVMVGGALVTYIASWSGWFASSKGYFRDWAEVNGHAGGNPVLNALRSLWHYHTEAYSFHVGLDTPHPYQANPLGWLLQLRPTNFYYRELDYGESGCQALRCVAQVNSVGNPLIWWLGTAAVLVCLVMGLLWRDGRALAALAGLAAGYLPWLLYIHRTIFTFYSVVYEPFLVLCLAYVFGLLLGPREAERDRRLAGGLFVASLLVLIVMVSAFFWPIWTGQVIPQSQWHWRMWLPSWP